MAPIIRTAGLLALLAQGTLGALYTDPSQLPRSTYDFIIVGGA